MPGRLTPRWQSVAFEIKAKLSHSALHSECAHDVEPSSRHSRDRT
ncbi:hypothetical protein FRUB_02300 [Fimbriiglobus ruber]|uniref:Uncharacterized protein n=1 Tax=Fimbriiglobus ruber TaxID=1908690 RepID=A0A225E0N4_9BACT|nr:hypothetical protein FRUB_02300 [Fimbriiglobus ruber]